jgi:NAD+ kinase
MNIIGVTANTDNPRAEGILARLALCAAAHGLTLVAWDETAAQLKSMGIPFRPGRVDESDALMVLGGDGTMLRAVRDMGSASRPVIGVNIGSLGFLTSVAESDLERAVECLARDAFTTSARAMATCSVIRNETPLGEFLCLNDLVVRNGDSGRIVSLDISVDGGAATPISADGLIIATPTGSTGHSLSAGGPILHPAAASFVVTFICAHALSARPLVIPDSSVIEAAVVRCASAVSLIVDGQSVLALKPGDRVRASKALSTVLFIHLPGYDFLSLLHHKLHWQGASFQSSAG